jgi:hypothetical protein
MNRLSSKDIQTRRDFLATSASGIGGVALASLLADEGLLGAPAGSAFKDPLTPRKPHFDGKAKACISIFMAGAPSQLDLFDPKPKLNEMTGKSLPKSVIDKARFAFIKPETATLLGTKRTFKKYGQCGMEFSDIVPHLGSVADDLLMVRSMPANCSCSVASHVSECRLWAHGSPMDLAVNHETCPATSY